MQPHANDHFYTPEESLEFPGVFWGKNGVITRELGGNSLRDRAILTWLERHQQNTGISAFLEADQGLGKEVEAVGS
jgi:hypothetical protein